MGNKKGITLRKKEDLRRFFYPQEWNDFINNAPEKLKFHYNFLMQTGMRTFESTKVEVRDIDFERNNIKVRFAKTRIGGVKRFKIFCDKCLEKINVSKDLKFCSSCGHEVKDIEKVIEEFSKQIINRRREIRKVRISNDYTNELKNIIKIGNYKSQDNFKFPSRQHLRQTMHNVLKKIGVKDWRDLSPHNIRKTHENYLIATGSNVLSLRMHMGHSIDVATAHYISNNLFNEEEIGMIKMIIGKLKI